MEDFPCISSGPFRICIWPRGNDSKLQRQAKAVHFTCFSWTHIYLCSFSRQVYKKLACSLSKYRPRDAVVRIKLSLNFITMYTIIFAKHPKKVIRFLVGDVNTNVPQLPGTKSHRLRWMRHAVRMSDDRLARRALFAEPISSRKMPLGGQHMTWQRNMKSLTEGLSHVGAVRFAGWGPRYASHL